ncbi:DUF7344 domain-containing protein [Halorussus caseinilyticus]|uniref:DUF7344 domain-containing protein n=1 Tax=Halorussus caseinilyticus TaxID=3034025 RepID=A0ABD5WGZ9_9EURY|nr:hypothetical protein [Halorussus sp. DT72]
MTTTDSRQDTTANARRHSPERDAPLDATFDALSNRQCRDLLRHLVESDDDAFLVADLATQLTDETDSETAETRMLARLHHTHLPKLADAGLVSYDPDRGLVQYRPESRFEAMVPTIESFESADYPVSLDALLDLFADHRRRTAYVTLLGHDDLSLPDLADEVAVAEYGQPLPDIEPDDVLQVYLSLYHTHVPKLGAAGLVEYDQADDYVRLTDAGWTLESPFRSLCDPADD